MAGLFATPLILVATAIVALLTVFLHRWMPQPPAATTHTNPWPAVALGGVLIAASVLLWPPGEFAIGGLDPGVYFNAGASLARTGTFEQRDTLLADAGSAARAAVIQGVPGTHADLLPGFYWNDQTSSITPQFPFLLTIWTGLVVVLAGPAGGAAVPLITGLAALVCFYAFAQRILGQWQGVAATALLAVNGAFLWHSRTHYSEPLLLAFLFGGLWAALVWREERNALAGVVVGLSLGLLPVIKTEAVLLGPLAAAAVGLSVLVQRDPLSLTLSRQGREDRSPAASKERLPLKAVAFARNTDRPDNVSSPLRGEGQGEGDALSITTDRSNAAAFAQYLLPYLATSLLTLTLYIRFASPILLDQAPRGWGYIVVAGVVGALLTLAWWARSNLHFGRRAVVAVVVCCAIVIGVTGIPLGQISFLTIGFPIALWTGSFLSPIDGVLLLLAIVMLVRGPLPARSTSRGLVAVFLLAGAAVYLALFYRYFLRMDDNALHMWADRRLLPIVLPLVAIAEAWAVATLASFAPARSRAVLAVAIVGMVLAARWPDAEPLTTTREYQGSVAAALFVAAQTESDAVILMDNDALGIRLSAPLRFIGERSTYILRQPNDAAIADFLTTARAQLRPVYYLTATRALATTLGNPGGDVTRFSSRLPELERTSLHRPRAAGVYLMEGSLYRIAP